MSLSDFWDNVTTPEFLKNALDELLEIYEETADEFKEIFEDGEELVTDAFRHTVIERKGEYQFTSERRKTARADMEEAAAELLRARGVTSKSQFLFDFAEIQLEKHIKALEVYLGEEEGLLEAVESRLMPLLPASLTDLAKMRVALLDLLQVESRPKYKPAPKNEDSHGVEATGSHMRRQQRQKATDAYLKQAAEYCERQSQATERIEEEDSGFNIKRLSKSQRRQLKKLCSNIISPDSDQVSHFVKTFYPGQSFDEDGSFEEIEREIVVQDMQRLTCIYSLVARALPAQAPITEAMQTKIDEVVAAIPSPVRQPGLICLPRVDA